MGKLFQKIFKKEEVLDVEKLKDQAELSFVQCRFDRDLYIALADVNHETLKFCDFVRDCMTLTSKTPILLDDEVERICSYITYFQLSREEVIHCKYECGVEKDRSLKIDPFILLPLIKNALCYGYNTMPNHPLRIRLVMSGSHKIKLEVSNRVNHNLIAISQEDNDDIRLFKARLQLLYGDNYELYFNSNSNLFKATLIIDMIR